MDKETLERFARKAVKISSNNKMIKTTAKRDKDGFAKQPIIDLWTVFRYNQAAVEAFLTSSDAVLEISTNELITPSERDNLNNLADTEQKLGGTVHEVKMLTGDGIIRGGNIVPIDEYMSIAYKKDTIELNKLGELIFGDKWTTLEYDPEIFIEPTKPSDLIKLETEVRSLIAELIGDIPMSKLNSLDGNELAEILTEAIDKKHDELSTQESTEDTDISIVQELLDKASATKTEYKKQYIKFSYIHNQYVAKLDMFHRQLDRANNEIYSGISSLLDKLSDVIHAEAAINNRVRDRFDAISANAKTINDKSKDLYKRTSVFSFYIGAYYFCGVIGKNEVKAPLIMIPVNVDIQASSITISHTDTRDIIVNNILMLLLQNLYGKTDALNFHPIDLDIETIQSRVESIISLFRLDLAIPSDLEPLPCKDDASTFIEIKFACGYTTYEVMSSIYRDIKELASHGDEESSIDRLFNLKYDDCGKLNPTYRISQLDTSQMNAIKMVDNCSGTVIFGPPGTGKSEVITNIIIDQVRKGKKCLVVSQKSTALDVVYNRLRDANRIALYMPDSSVRSGGKAVGSGPDIINSINRRLDKQEFGEFEACKVETLDSMIEGKLRSLESIHELLSTPVQECSKSLSEMYAEAIPYDLIDKVLVTIRSKYSWMLDMTLPQVIHMYSSISDNQIWLAFVSVQNLGDNPETYHNMGKNDLMYVERELTELKKSYMELRTIEEIEAKYPYTILRDIYKSIEQIHESLDELGIKPKDNCDSESDNIAICGDLRDNLQKISLELSSYKTMLSEKRLKRSVDTELDYYLRLKEELSHCESLLQCESLASSYDASDISSNATINVLSINNLLDAVNNLYKIMRQAGEKYGIEVKSSNDLRKSKESLLFNEYDTVIDKLNDVLKLYSKYRYSEISCSDALYEMIFKDPWGYKPLKLGFVQMLIGKEKAKNTMRAANIAYTINTATKRRELFCRDIDKYIEYISDLESEYKQYFDSLATELNIHYDESIGLMENMLRAIAYAIAAYKNISNTISSKLDSVYQSIIEYDRQFEEIKQLAQSCVDNHWEISNLGAIENSIKTLIDKESKGEKLRSSIKDGMDLISEFGLSADVDYELNRLISYKSNSASISLVGTLTDREYGLLSLMYECNCQFDDVIKALITYRLNDLEDLSMDEVCAKNIKKIIQDINSYEIFRAKYILETLECAPSYMELYSAMSAGIGKRARHPTLRSFIGAYQDLLLDNFPVWIMTPESVSDVLPLRKNMFDLVIFDEASQLYLWAAIPSIYRAAKIAVAGDDKQLKPENLFNTRLDDEEPTELDEDINLSSGDKSLLDQAKETFNSVQLQFHYRARYSELIQFSNYAFYNNTLNVAPNLHRDGEPIVYRYLPNSIVDKHVNQMEAEEVANIILDEIKNSHDCTKTFGVITMNIYQRNGVKQAFDDMCARISSRDAKIDDKRAFEVINKLNSSPDTEIFIKSIADVQGDERDIIIFSLGYGYDTNGRLKCNLGMLNTLGGENRLNVAISRAKEKEYIVASILPSDIGDTDRFTNDGGKQFKQFLQYAKAISDGDIKTANSIVQVDDAGKEDSESKLQESIKAELEARGFEVHTNIGVGDFVVRLAIFNRQLGKYIGCIEYDDEFYRKSSNTYSRDVMRERFLISRGWRVLRVTSRDWWKGLEQEADRIQRELSEASSCAEYTMAMYTNELSLQDIHELLCNIHSGCTVDTGNNAEVIETTYNRFSRRGRSYSRNNGAEAVKDISIQNENFYTVENYRYIADKISTELGTLTYIYTGSSNSWVELEDASKSKIDINSIVIGDAFQIKVNSYGDLVIAAIVYKVALRELVGDEDPMEAEAKYLNSLRTKVLRGIEETIRSKVIILNSAYCISKALSYEDTMKKCKLILGEHAGGFKVSKLDIDHAIYNGLL